MEVIVVQTRYIDTNKTVVIGVTDTIEMARKIVEDYYGKHELIKEVEAEIIEYPILFDAVIRVNDALGEYYVNVWAEYFDLNKI